jgi:hypothetical protein
VATMSSQGMALVICVAAFACLGWAMVLIKRRTGTALRRSAGTGELTYSEKFSRLAVRLRDPQWRSYGIVMLAGKMLGIAVLFGIIAAGTMVVRTVSGTPVYAQPTAADGVATQSAAPDPYKAVTAGDLINPVNTAWVLLGAFLVFGMQAGFTMLEAGFCRDRETVNVLVECMFDTCVCGLLHWGWGFAFMFGGGNAFVGWHLPGDPTKSLIFMKDVDVLTTYGASASRFWRTISSSSPSLTAPRRSARGRWSGGPGSSATCCIHSASRA